MEFSIFFHPDSTVGPGVSPDHAKRLADFYRRSGITPCPEDIWIIALHIAFDKSLIQVYTEFNYLIWRILCPQEKPLAVLPDTAR